MGRGLLSASRLGSRPLRRPCTRRRLAPNSAGPCGAAPGPSPRPRGRPDPPRVVCHFPAARGVAGLPASGPRAGSAWRHWTAARRSQPSTSTTRPVPAASPPHPHEANTPGRRPPPHSGASPPPLRAGGAGPAHRPVHQPHHPGAAAALVPRDRHRPSLPGQTLTSPTIPMPGSCSADTPAHSPAPGSATSWPLALHDVAESSPSLRVSRCDTRVNGLTRWRAATCTKRPAGVSTGARTPAGPSLPRAVPGGYSAKQRRGRSCVGSTGLGSHWALNGERPPQAAATHDRQMFAAMSTGWYVIERCPTTGDSEQSRCAHRSGARVVGAPGK